MDFKDALKNMRNEDTESIKLLTKTNNLCNGNKISKIFKLKI